MENRNIVGAYGPKKSFSAWLREKAGQPVPVQVMGAAIMEDARAPKRSIVAWIEETAGHPLRLRDKIIGALLIVIFLFAFYIALDANKYRAMVHVIDGAGKVGVNPTTSALDFGDLSRGTSAVRRVDIANGTTIPMYIVIVKTGGLSDLVSASKNYFTVAPHTDTKVEFTTYVPASAQIDARYDGRVYLFKIPVL